MLTFVLLMKWDVSIVANPNLHLHRTQPYIEGAFKKTGILPFTRSAHLDANQADVQLGDALVAAERMLQRQRKREVQVLAQTTIDVTTPHPLPMVIRELREISEMYGPADTKPTKADAYGLCMWPKFDATRRSPHVWQRCLQLSPQLQTRFTSTDPVELLKFFDVGLLLEEHMDQLSPEQALILGYTWEVECSC